MGLFDELKCSYNIGELTNVTCQSKNIDDWGGTMTFYWVDPAGRLWTPDYSGTYNFASMEGKFDDIKYLKSVPNGNHGKYSHVNMTRTIEIYDVRTHPDGLTDWVTCYLTFCEGVLVDYMYK